MFDKDCLAHSSAPTIAQRQQHINDTTNAVIDDVEGRHSNSNAGAATNNVDVAERLMSDDDLLVREDWARFDMLERQLDGLFARHAAQLDEKGELLGVDMVKDPMNEPDISEMVTGDETASRPINRYRQILYTEGELDQSDLDQPPSRRNPHPFDPTTLPPTHSRQPTPYANNSPTIQMLLELGVDLFDVCQAPKIGRALLRLDPVRDVKWKIFWLVKRVGVQEADVGSYLSRNPYFLLQSFRRFTRAQIAKIVTEYRYWLNHAPENIDGRVLKEPRLIQFGVGPIQGFVIALSQSCGFSQRDLKQILLKDPRVFLLDKPHLLTSFNYLAYVMRIPNNQIVAYPMALRCPLWALCRTSSFTDCARPKMLDVAMFYVNRVRTENMTDPAQAQWATTWGAIFNALQTYIKQWHTTGVVWNSAPGAQPSNAQSGKSTPKKDGSPPPSLPPPEDLFAPSSGGGGEGSDRQALFNAINKAGVQITTGLKKLTSDMQTHKNLTLRGQMGGLRIF
uniref:CAP_N domain-containing protein n=1 Tax=Globodera pallida TaxID=36090 RepID=A0A183BRL3_GLOPA